MKVKEEEKNQEVEGLMNASEEVDNRLYLEVEIEGKKCRALFDPGATCSLIGPGVSRDLEKKLLPSKSKTRTFRWGNKSSTGRPTGGCEGRGI